jgi:hypothetical protein
MVGAIPAPHDAWRKSDILTAATGYQCCGSRDVKGISGDLDVRDGPKQAAYGQETNARPNCR